MNILKLAEKMQVFSLNEIELLAEKDCTEELNRQLICKHLFQKRHTYTF